MQQVRPVFGRKRYAGIVINDVKRPGARRCNIFLGVGAKNADRDLDKVYL